MHWNWPHLKFCPLVKSYRFTTQSSFLTTLFMRPFEKHCSKRRKCWSTVFSPFHPILPFPRQISISKSHWFCRLQILSICSCVKFYRSVNRLRSRYTYILIRIYICYNSLCYDLNWLIDWIVFYTTFNSISVISWQQLTLFMSFLGFTSTRLGLWSVFTQGHSHKKNPEESSMSGTQDRYTLPLNHAGPPLPPI